MRNHLWIQVVGVRPLYLAAQCGHMAVVKALVAAGADPTSPCHIAGKASEVNTAATNALMNNHFRVWWYLRGLSSSGASADINPAAGTTAPAQHQETQGCRYDPSVAKGWLSRARRGAGALRQPLLFDGYSPFKP